MRLIPWDPDVQTVIIRIDSGAIDLQPDFQRGEVWPRSKKQRLIDSILRNWHVPPIHVIENDVTQKQEVLDGQQRLAAIRDFVHGEFAVDGQTAPADELIGSLNGLKYRELPPQVRRQFDQFTLRVYRIVDFKSSEPAELFFRLNQPTNLTGAEQRNAFFGPVRDQVRDLVKSLLDEGLDKEFLGFSNVRMSYDDVVSRVVLTLERGSIGQKIASNDLVELYRREEPVTRGVESLVLEAIKLLAKIRRFELKHPRFNKATLYSWLVFLVRGINSGNGLFNSRRVAEFMDHFERLRSQVSLGLLEDDEAKTSVAGRPLDWLLSVYEDRSTSRVADVSSIVLRDIVLWLLFSSFVEATENERALHLPLAPLIAQLQSDGTVDEDALAKGAIEAGWARVV